MGKSIKKNSIYSVIKTGASIVFPLITFPYISRVLLTENVGKINFGLSVVSYFSLIASLGITTYAIRECSAEREDKKRLSNTASQIFSINVIAAVSAYILLALTLLLCRSLDSYRTLIIIQSITIIASTLGADWLNLAMEDFKYITLRTLSCQILSLVLMVVFVHRPEDYIKYAVISLVSSAGASITNIWYRKRYCRVFLTVDIDWKKHLFPIIYLFVMLLSQTIFNSVDSTMLGLMHGDYEVGIYSTAHKISTIINQVIGSLAWVVMPRMSYFFVEGDYKKINRLLRKILQFNITLGLPCTVGIFLLSSDVIRVIAGSEYDEAASVLRILMFGFAFSLIGGSFLGNAVLLPSKQEKYYMVVCCTAAVINIITNYLSIPYFGAKAAAGTTTLCSFFIMAALFFRVDKRIHIDHLFKLITAPVCGCVMIIIVCMLCRQVGSLYLRTFISVGASMVVYFVSQICMKNDLVIELLGSIRKK